MNHQTGHDTREIGVCVVFTNDHFTLVLLMAGNGRTHHAKLRRNPKLSIAMERNDWCVRPRFCTVRLYWSWDNLD